MARPFPEVALPDHPAVRPVHREDRRPAVLPVRRAGRHPVHLGEDRRRQEARRPERKASRWEAELRVRVVG